MKLNDTDVKYCYKRTWLARGYKATDADHKRRPVIRTERAEQLENAKTNKYI